MKIDKDELIENMAMLMRRLVHSPDNLALRNKSIEFLNKYALAGAPLRTDNPQNKDACLADAMDRALWALECIQAEAHNGASTTQLYQMAGCELDIIRAKLKGN